MMTGRGAATALSKVTWVLGIAFVVTSLALTVIAARDSGSGSVIDRLGDRAPPRRDATPAHRPGLDGDLLPPLPRDRRPAAPPPAAAAAGRSERAGQLLVARLRQSTGYCGGCALPAPRLSRID